ncbi:hypothetical protein Aperf_G00000019669 [Anoplocephala perfoliata]
MLNINDIRSQIEERVRAIVHAAEVLHMKERKNSRSDRFDLVKVVVMNLTFENLDGKTAAGTLCRRKSDGQCKTSLSIRVGRSIEVESHAYLQNAHKSSGPVSPNADGMSAESSGNFSVNGYSPSSTGDWTNQRAIVISAVFIAIFLAFFPTLAIIGIKLFSRYRRRRKTVGKPSLMYRRNAPLTNSEPTATTRGGGYFPYVESYEPYYGLRTSKVKNNATPHEAFDPAPPIPPPRDLPMANTSTSAADSVYEMSDASSHIDYYYVYRQKDGDHSYYELTE